LDQNQKLLDQDILLDKKIEHKNNLNNFNKNNKVFKKNLKIKLNIRILFWKLLKVMEIVYLDQFQIKCMEQINIINK